MYDIDWKLIICSINNPIPILCDIWGRLYKDRAVTVSDSDQVSKTENQELPGPQ